MTAGHAVEEQVHGTGGVVCQTFALDHQAEIAVCILNSDPLTLNEAQPARSVAALVRANERLRREFGRITLPLLILHGTADRATLASGSRLFHDAVLADVRAWIDAWIAA